MGCGFEHLWFHFTHTYVSYLALAHKHTAQTILTELSYSEHWPAVLGAVGGLVDASDPRVWRKVGVVVDPIQLIGLALATDGCPSH